MFPGHFKGSEIPVLRPNWFPIERLFLVADVLRHQQQFRHIHKPAQRITGGFRVAAHICILQWMQ